MSKIQEQVIQQPVHETPSVAEYHSIFNYPKQIQNASWRDETIARLTDLVYWYWIYREYAHRLCIMQKIQTFTAFSFLNVWWCSAFSLFNIICNCQICFGLGQTRLVTPGHWSPGATDSPTGLWVNVVCFLWVAVSFIHSFIHYTFLTYTTKVILLLAQVKMNSSLCPSTIYTVQSPAISPKKKKMTTKSKWDLIFFKTTFHSDQIIFMIEMCVISVEPDI